MNREVIVEVRRMNKRFGSTVALSDVNISVRRGEIQGLIGENGSGKSTVTSIISGMQRADGGEMSYLGEKWQPQSMLQAMDRGIGMIVQESGTVPGITVAENIFLGETKRFKAFGHDKTYGKGRRGGESSTWGVVRKGQMLTEAQEALDRIGASHIRADMTAGALDMQDRKLVEIARVMNKNPQVLIVDETTTALSQLGRDIIYRIMRGMRGGKAGLWYLSPMIWTKSCRYATP